MRIENLHSADQLHEAGELLGDIWQGAPRCPPVPLELMRALVHSGNYVAGAFLDQDIVGVSVGFFAGGEEKRALHSHITGVRPAWEGRGIGYELKQHQRRWSMAHGLDQVHWTFDPLVARNAWFNVTKLGARISEYLPDFYGAMADSINAGDESDRCLVTWELNSERARAAANGDRDEPDLAALRAAGAVLLLDSDDAGRPRKASALSEGTTLSCGVPRDIVALRATAPGLAREWRLALRATMGVALEQGFAVTAVTRTGWYVLTKDLEAPT